MQKDVTQQASFSIVLHFKKWHTVCTTRILRSVHLQELWVLRRTSHVHTQQRYNLWRLLPAGWWHLKPISALRSQL